MPLGYRVRIFSRSHNASNEVEAYRVWAVYYRLLGLITLTVSNEYPFLTIHQLSIHIIYLATGDTI